MTKFPSQFLSKPVGAIWVAVILTHFATVAAEPDPTGLVLTGANVVGHGPAVISIRHGRIEAITKAPRGDDVKVVALDGRYIAPSYIDSHVHLANGYTGEQLARGGIVAVVDMAAPIPYLTKDHSPLRVLQAGPMVTAIQGYPTQSWGSDGYGLETSSVDAARAAVEFLYASGARLIKIPVGDTTGGGAILGMKENKSTLTDAQLKTIVEQAHARGVLVAAHAITDQAAMRAANAGADVLAHTPTQPLTAETVAAWSDRAVISTLAGFKHAPVAVENFRRFREAGATVMYGTDLGYTKIAAVNPVELELLGKAGLDGAAILAAGTSTPAKYWGFEGLGRLAPGAAANFLILDADPRQDPSTLARPISVYLNGVKLPQPSQTSEQN